MWNARFTKKKEKKRRLSAWLAALAVLAGLLIFSAGGAWAANVSINKTTGETISIPVYSENDTLKISGGPLVGSDWDILKSLTLKFDLVLNDETTDIPDNALLQNGAITGLTGNKVTSVGDQAFYGCTSLEAISLSEAVTVGDQAFYECTSLETISLPEATSVGSSAFSYTSLETVSLPKAVNIGSSAFSYCASLKTVSLPEAVAINDFAFSNCASLSTMVLSDDAPLLGVNVVFNNVPGPLAVFTEPTGVGSDSYSDNTKRWQDNTSNTIITGGFYVNPTITFDPEKPSTIKGTVGSAIEKLTITVTSGGGAAINNDDDISYPILPAGLQMVLAFGEGCTCTITIQGTPTTVGKGTIQFGVTNAAGHTASVDVAYSIADPADPGNNNTPGGTPDPAPDGTTDPDRSPDSAEPPTIPENILDALPANATASAVRNADGTYGIEVHIPFDANFDPSEIEWIAVEAEGFSGIRVWHTDASGNETELTVSAATRGAAASRLKITGTAPDRESAERAKVVKVTVKKKNDAATYEQNLDMKLADASGWSLPPDETGGGNSGVGCGVGFGGFALLAVLSLALRRKNRIEKNERECS